MLTRRILGLVALSLAPGLAIQAYNEHALRGAREQAVAATAMRSAKAAVDALSQFGEASRQVMAIVADEPSVRTRDGATCSETLRDTMSKVPGATILAITRDDGTVACSSLGASAIGYSVADRSYFRTGMATGDFALGEYLVGRGTHRPTLQFVLPLADAAGRRTGIAYMGYDPDWVGRRMARSGIPAGATLTVTDRNGIVLVRSPDGPDWVGKPLPDRFRSAQSSAVGRVAEMDGLSGMPKIMAVLAPDGALDGFTVSVGLSRETAFADIDAASSRGQTLIALGALLAFGAALLGNRVMIQRPVRRMTAVAEAWRAGHLDVRNSLDGRSEIGRLGLAFDAMADALQAREADLRDEIDRGRTLQGRQVTMLHELNHRVKNTLATVQSLARQSRGGEAQAEQLEGRILALSKTHDLLVRDDWTGASWREILESELGPYRDRADRFVLSGDDVELPPRYVLALGMTVHELTTNAAKYGALSGDPGQVFVTWTLRGEAGPSRLRIEWREAGGPRVAKPERRGFGTRMITGGVARELSGEVEIHYDAPGLRCVIDVPLEAMPERGAVPAFTHVPGPAPAAALH